MAERLIILSAMKITGFEKGAFCVASQGDVWSEISLSNSPKIQIPSRIVYRLVAGFAVNYL